MHRLVVASLAAAGLSVGISAAVSAADLSRAAPVPVYTKAPPVAAPYGWSGFYVGGNAGYAWHSSTALTFTPNDPLVQATTCGGVFGGTCAPPASFGTNGGFGGLQAGYNWQFNRTWLLGVETDFDWSGIRGTGQSNFILGSGAPAASSFQATQDIDWFGTVRARLGYLPTSNLLLYGTAGLAYGHIKENVALNSQPGANAGGFGFAYVCVTGPNCFLGSSTRTSTGWTAGAGLEYMLTNNISIKGEYLHVNLGNGDTVNVVAQNTGALPTPSSFSARYSAADFDSVRAGLNVKFGNW